MHNILFITETIPDKLFSEKVGLTFYKNKGISVKILYIAGLSRPTYYKKIKKKSDLKYHDGKNKDLIIDYFNNNNTKKTIVFCLYRKNRKTIFINEFLFKEKIKTAFISMESTLQHKLSLLEKIKIFFLSPILFFKLLIFKLNHFKNYNINYDYVFTAGKLSEEKYKKNSNSKVFKIHHYDLDYFKNSKPFKKDKNYALFLSPASLNPDIYDKNPGREIEKNLIWFNENYIKNMKKFLKKLSNYTKTKIIIAEHPKETLKLKNFFTFKSYRGISSKLIKNANFVLCFDSTAFQLAVLCNKPILFLTSKNLPEFIKNNIKSRSLFFDKYPINIENQLNEKELKFNLKLNKNVYKKYIKLYISNTKKSFYKYRSYELIFRYLKRIK